MSIDITFDFRSDTPPGGDPDALSPTLRRCHKALWSKMLPSGERFTLDDSGPYYLHHRSELGEFFLASDAVIPTFTGRRSTSSIVSKIPPNEVDSFFSLAYTIGGMMVFPGNRVGGKMTINQARGFHPWINDRFDLTVECIRRHYLEEPSPLDEVLARYADFFRLFRDFTGYVEYFLLQDMVSDDCSAVRFSAPFEDFAATSPLPKSVDAYLAYRECAMNFIRARNLRIASLDLQLDA